MKTTVKGLSLSGASTKIPAIAGAAITLMKDFNYQPRYISGISAGSILAVPLAMGLYDDIKTLVLSFNLDTIFDNKPVNEEGKITLKAIFRLLRGKESLGTQNNLRNTLAKVITEEKFKEYRNNHRYATCYIGYVEYKTGERHYVNAKFLTHDQYLDAVMASTSIPFFVESVKIHGGYCYDGGVRDHIGSHWLLGNFNSINEHFSIYSRPANYDITEKHWVPKNIFNVLNRTISIMNTEISKNDEEKEDRVCKDKGIKNHKIFMPHLLANSTYEVSPQLLKEWYNIGRREIFEYFKNNPLEDPI